MRSDKQAAGEPTAKWQVMEVVMTKVIEFYVPDSFPRKFNWIAGNERGKVIEFRLPREEGLATESRESADAKDRAIPIWTL